jgi:hypothetical protein
MHLDTKVRAGEIFFFFVFDHRLLEYVDPPGSVVPRSEPLRFRASRARGRKIENPEDAKREEDREAGCRTLKVRGHTDPGKDWMDGSVSCFYRFVFLPFRLSFG